ncbi:hypothetical protein FHW69_002738 [Luteibacter sp. Sphag1AF]|uniref:hypothetical protein n=1 Tax=Luteibacter sp. Sphag1AF TaxID=2587031 RepID=UPI00160A50A9|nr:hypothetical protein [Luteibacter sp. Sphag1AF]MBB3228103.1 hypothetical protein [Luteibacter sp. Sphag1AF]
MPLVARLDDVLAILLEESEDLPAGRRIRALLTPDVADAMVLETLRATFDTTQLLHLVDQWNELCMVMGDPDALRADLLRLHAD